MAGGNGNWLDKRIITILFVAAQRQHFPCYNDARKRKRYSVSFDSDMMSSNNEPGAQNAYTPNNDTAAPTNAPLYEPHQPQESSADNTQPGIKPQRSLVRDVVEILLLIVTIYTLVNLATARAVVEGQSMEPNFHTGQFVIVNRFAYYFAKPQRGDVIVLHAPRDPSQDYIKRVVGLPGESIQIKAGRVYVNGTMIDEPYIAHFCTTNCDGEWKLKDTEYFVLGDNRNNSYDGHSFGPIPSTLIVGQAWVRYWPISDIAIIQHPRYGDIQPNSTVQNQTNQLPVLAATTQP
jgi:signal peptidase I